MQTIALPYGGSALALSFDSNRFHVVVPPEVPQVSERFLIDSPPLSDLLSGKRVLVIVSDLTRPTGSLQFLPPLLETMNAAASISFLFATGLHRPLNEADKI